MLDVKRVALPGRSCSLMKLLYVKPIYGILSFYASICQPLLSFLSKMILHASLRLKHKKEIAKVSFNEFTLMN